VKPQLRVRALLIVALLFAGVIVGSVSATTSGSTFTVSSSIGSTSLKGGMTLSGSVVWTATPSATKPITKVDFFIDGKLKWTEKYSPYQYNGDGNTLDTTTLSNGSHTLKVRATRSDGNTTSTSATVSVSNTTKPTFTTTSSIANGATLSGAVTWTASPTGATVSQVDFMIDGVVKWTEKISPYYFNGDGSKLDTTTLANGGHTLSVIAYSTDGQKATASSSVTVSNSTSSPLTVTSNVANGATLTGSVTWTASTSGGTISKVDFLVDGSVKYTDSTAPYQYNGDGGTLNTTTLSSGGHTLAEKATATDGRTATASSSVTISNSTTTPFAVTSSVAAGATLGGSITWTASPSGATASKVDFLIDGAVKSTDSTAPYQFNGDGGQLNTTTLTNGSHTLAVNAYATDGRTASTSGSVTISNSTPSTSYGSIPRFGIATGYKILTRTPAQQNFELDQIKAVGAKIVRFDSLPGNQAQVDPVVNGVLARGMEPLLVLFGTTGPISPSTAASFAGSQAAKWKGKVRLYEFANEPDLHGWNGTNYAQALIPAYNAIKAADPNAIVIAGALWKGAGGPVQWVTDMYNAGAKGHFDILSMHLYDDPLASGSWNIWNMAFHMTPCVRSVMDAHGDSAIPIASTETGGPTTSYGETGQATIIGHDFDALSDPRLAFVLVYSMMDDVVTSQPGFGLLRPDLSRRPSWDVYHTRAAAMS
jgi:hypothetical protein